MTRLGKRKLETDYERPSKRRKLSTGASTTEQRFPPNENDEYVIERIVHLKEVKNGNTECLVAWRGYPGEDTWEPIENMPSELIQEFANSQSNRDDQSHNTTVCCYSKNKVKSVIQCTACELFMHRACVGVRRGRRGQWTCPPCTRRKETFMNCSDDDEKSRSESSSPQKTQSRRSLRSQSTLSPDLGDRVDSGEDSRLDEEEEKDESYQEDEDVEMYNLISESDVESEVERKPKTRPRRQNARRRVNPWKEEVETSSDELKPRRRRERNTKATVVSETDCPSDSSVEVLPANRPKRRKKKPTRPPIGLRGLDKKWLEGLTWEQIENMDRDHDNVGLPDPKGFSSGSVLVDTGDVDEKQCPVFMFEPDAEVADDIQLHVWRSDAKQKFEVKREEPLGNFRADYNGTETICVNLILNKDMRGRVKADVDSQVRFDAEGTACVHVSADWSWKQWIENQINEQTRSITHNRQEIRRRTAEIEELKQHPEYPFTRKIRNKYYSEAAARQHQLKNRYYHQTEFIDHPNKSRQRNNLQWISNSNASIRRSNDRITNLEKDLALCWGALTSQYSEWIPVSRDSSRENRRADLYGYFSSAKKKPQKNESAYESRKRKKNPDELERQELLDLMIRAETNKSAARKLDRVLRLAQTTESMEVSQPSVVAATTKFLFTDTIHNVAVTIKQVMNDELPYVPDVIVAIISGFAEDDKFVKDVVIDPTVLIDALSQPNGLPADENFLKTYILQTNCPKRGSTLVDTREVLFYQSSNVPSSAQELMDRLDDAARDRVSEHDLRGIAPTLYKYQVRSFVWMRNLERKILHNHKWFFGAKDLYIDANAPTFDGEHTNFPLVLDHINQRISVYSEHSFDRSPRFVSSSGGVLADEVGLGKTLTTICVLFGNRPSLKKIQALNCVKTTLIIAPSHLLHQWREEMLKHVKRDWDIFEVPTKTQFMKVTPARLYAADVLLVSTNFLKGKFYDDYRVFHKSWLETVKFWRVIVDEGHELVDSGNKKARENMLRINAVHYWYLSGTPFPSGKALAFCCRFIRLRVADRPVEETEFLLRTSVGDVLEKMLVNHLVMRNTKVSVDELHIPKRIETPAFVTLHPVELGLYKICRDLYPQDARQICTDIASIDAYRIASVGDEELQVMTRTSNLACGLNILPGSLARDRLDQQPRQRTIVRSLEALVDIEEEKEHPDKTFLRSKKRELALEKKRLSRIEREIAFCKSKELKNALEVWKFEHHANPLRYATLLLGSKFSKAVLWISNLVKSNLNVRIIAFSNFNKVLQNYHKYLNTVMKVKTVFCKGNVYVRRKAVQSFQSDGVDPVRVILLSIQKSASGANLTRATHVCLLDPVAASASQAVASEEQAVGRALRQGMSKERHCQIIRFVAKDTIEHELFNRNQEQRQQNEGDGEL